MTTYSVWYMRPEFFRDGMMGADWLKQRGRMPDPGKLTDSHIFVRYIEAEDLEQVFVAMQAERWSPRGEARPLIEARGLQHTSMSVGDIAVDLDTWTAHLVDRFGFVEIGGPVGPRLAADY